MQRKNFYLTLLALTFGMASSINALAQVSIPTPAGRWTFDNTSDLLALDAGSGMSLIPYTTGTKSVAESTLGGAGIVTTSGPTTNNKAVTVPAASALKVNRESSAVATRNYTIMMDIKMTNATTKCISLLQTNPYNNNDGDLFVNSGKIGQYAQLGAYSGEGVIGDNTWYRIVLACRNDGYVYVYVNGTKVLTSTKEWNNAYEIDPWGFFLFCDEDSEAEDVQVAEVAYWETGLSDAQVEWLSHYKISNANDLKDFAELVNNGYNTTDAYLAADIDMTGATWPNPIGNWNTNNVNSAYKGHFDGQGHTISNLTYTAAKNYHGLFGVVSEGAVIENFTVSGTITNNAYKEYLGVVGFSRDNTVNLRDIHSELNFIHTRTQSHTISIGGILGYAAGGTTNIDRCTYSGNFQITDSYNDDNGMYGGIVGWIYNNAGAIVHIADCLFDGTMTNTETTTMSGCVLGGIIGYVGENATYTVNNCLSIGTVTSTVSGQLGGGINTGSGNNNYYKGSFIKGKGITTIAPVSVNDDQLASGEVCYNLGAAWYQTLGTDDYPTPDSSKPNVYKMTVGSAGYASFVPTVNVAAIPDGVTAYAGQKNGNYLHLEEVTELPADAAVIVKADAGNYYYNNTDDTRSLGTSNDLTFSGTSLTATGTQYCLADGASGVGFYLVQSGVSIPARKVYLTVPASVKAFYGFFDEEETSIDGPTPSLNGGEVYDLAGRKVQGARGMVQEDSSTINSLRKGIYIVNGKKILK